MDGDGDAGGADAVIGGVVVAAVVVNVGGVPLSVLTGAGDTDRCLGDFRLPPLGLLPSALLVVAGVVLAEASRSLLAASFILLSFNFAKPSLLSSS